LLRRWRGLLINKALVKALAGPLINKAIVKGYEYVHQSILCQGAASKALLKWHTLATLSDPKRARRDQAPDREPKKVNHI
jgi:hypothetical protein